MTKRRAAVKAIAVHLPERVLDNEELSARSPGWSAGEILEKTGIASRRIAAEGECASDLGVAAAKKLFGTGACGPEDVDFLIFCTQSPDHFLPPTGCLVQDRLGLATTCGTLDTNHGCSGFVYGLAVAKSLVECRLADRVLLVTAETYSKFIHEKDRSASTIFGDAAAATLVQVEEGLENEENQEDQEDQEDQEQLIGPFVFGTDGRGAENLIVPAGALRLPRGPETAREETDASGNVRSPENLRMNGPEIFTFTLKQVPRAVRGVLDRAGLDLEDVDHFVFHQANRFMLDRLRRKIRIPPERFRLFLEECGNTVSSTIPIVLDGAIRAGTIETGERILLVGFGVGYSWAAAMIRAAW